MPKIELLIIDKREIFREGLVSLTQSKSNIDVVSVSNKASQAVKAARAHNPHVVLMDIGSSEGSSIELIPRIHEVVPDAHIIMFTHSTEKALFFSAVRVGATGCISKDSSLETLVKMITLAAEGKVIVDLPIAKTVVTALQSLNGHRHEAMPERINLLTKQEGKVLTMMAQDNYTNKEIAEALFTTENTVKVHVHNIMRKLAAHSRLEATVRKYWPEEEQESEVKETPEVKVSLEDEFRLITTKNELTWDIAETLTKIENRGWETPELRKKGKRGFRN